MFEIGFGEFVVVILVALVVLGPEKLAESAESIGKFIATLKSNWQTLSDVTNNKDATEVIDNEK